MPIHDNSIGAESFQDLIGTIAPRQKQIEIIERPGVDDFGARNSGKRGKPFELVSIGYYESFESFHNKMADYLDLKDSLQILTRNSVIYGNVIIEEITEHKQPQAVLNVAGAPGMQCRAELQWKMRMLD
jgi:hypothetical protein